MVNTFAGVNSRRPGVPSRDYIKLIQNSDPGTYRVSPLHIAVDMARKSVRVRKVRYKGHTVRVKVYRRNGRIVRLKVIKSPVKVKRKVLIRRIRHR